MRNYIYIDLKKHLFMSLICFLFVLSLSTANIVAQSKPVTRVFVQVFSSEQQIKDKIYSLTTRELRSLNDVEISKKPEYKILIFAENTQGDRYALNFIVTKTVECIRDAKPKQTCDSVESFESISLLSESKLKSKIEDLVIYFDVNFLQPKRIE
ncbi:hypothetical protein BH20ACI1_BH20ACI1_11000 [soil metagenome]